MHKLATLGTLSLVMCGFLLPLSAHADIIQAVEDSVTSDEPKYDGGWSQELGAGISGTLTEADFRIVYQSPQGLGDRFGLTIQGCTDATYVSCGVLAISSGYFGPVGTTTLTFDNSILNLPFDPTRYYKITVTRILPQGYNTDRTFSVLGSSVSSYPNGATDAGGLADITFTLKGVSPVVATSSITNVLFLPGIEGSRLYDSSEKLWEPSGNASVDALDMDSSGDGNPAIHTRIGDVIANIGVIGVYGRFIDTMDQMVANGQIGTYEAIPYDWRMSVVDVLNTGHVVNGDIYYDGPNGATSTPYILQEFHALAAKGKVTIVAHSNGGLVAKALVKKLQDTNDPTLGQIDKVILVASPQVGTPEGVAAMLHGHDTGLPFHSIPFVVQPQHMRTLGVNAPGAYGLLPSDGYFSKVQDALIKIDGSLSNWVSTYGSAINSGSSERAFLAGTLDRVSPPSNDTEAPVTVNTNMLVQGEAFHNDIDNWTPPSNVRFIQIAGWGIDSTLKTVTYSAGRKSYCDKPESSSCTAFITGAKAAYESTIDGDGTVVTPSALWMNSAERYWVNLRKYDETHRIETGIFGVFKFDHGRILDTEPIASFIRDNITNSAPSDPTYGGYVSNTAPQATTMRLRYSLQSPLSLDLYDNAGHHTGISTTTGAIEQDIPGSYFVQYGDQKYAYIDEGVPTHIIMRGYATSTFTLSIKKALGDNVLASTTFQDLPVRPKTSVILDVGSTFVSLSPLQMDLNGDGITETVITPKFNATATVKPDSIPPEGKFRYDLTRGLVVDGFDDRSPTTTLQISATSTSTTLVDDYGNSTKLFYSKNEQKTGAVSLTLASLSYNQAVVTATPALLRYYWTQSKQGNPVIFFTLLRTSQGSIIALYSNLTNKTLIFAATTADENLDSGTLVTSLLSKPRTVLKQYGGLVIPYVLTQKGKVVIGY